MKAKDKNEESSKQFIESHNYWSNADIRKTVTLYTTTLLYTHCVLNKVVYQILMGFNSRTAVSKGCTLHVIALESKVMVSV